MKQTIFSGLSICQWGAMVVHDGSHMACNTNWMYLSAYMQCCAHISPAGWPHQNNFHSPLCHRHNHMNYQLYQDFNILLLSVKSLPLLSQSPCMMLSYTYIHVPQDQARKTLFALLLRYFISPMYPITLSPLPAISNSFNVVQTPVTPIYFPIR